MNTTFITTTKTNELEHAMTECDATFLEAAFEFAAINSNTATTQAEKQEDFYNYMESALDCVKDYLETSNE